MPIPILLFFLLIPILLWAFFTWDNLIKLEHENFHHQWVKNGKPTGMFWRPPNTSRSYSSGMATQKFMFVWLFKNPEWVESSDDGMRLIKRYRILVLVWNISVILWFFVGIRLFS